MIEAKLIIGPKSWKCQKVQLGYFWHIPLKPTWEDMNLAHEKVKLAVIISTGVVKKGK